MVGIVGVPRWAIVYVLAGEVVGVLAHVEGADEDRAGRLQPLDQRRILRGRRSLAIDLGPGERRQARDVEEVLHRERHACERSKRAAGPAIGVYAERLLSEDRLQELSQIGDLMTVLERRVALLSMMRSALEEHSVYLRIGTENETP